MESCEGFLDRHQTEPRSENTPCATVLEGGGGRSGAHGPRSRGTGSEFSSIPSLPPNHSSAPCREIQAPLSLAAWLHQHLAAHLWPGEAQSKSSQGRNQECPRTLGPIRLVEAFLCAEMRAWRSFAGNAECGGPCWGSEPSTPPHQGLSGIGTRGRWYLGGGSRRGKAGGPGRGRRPESRRGLSRRHQCAGLGLCTPHSTLG